MNLDNILSKVTIEGSEYYRLNAPNDFSFSTDIIKTLKQNYDPQKEHGGLICFSYGDLNGILRFEAKYIIYVSNRSQTPNFEYSPDQEELSAGYKKAYSEKLLPIAFHTHPTKYVKNDDIISEGMHYLEQLNTSVEDKGYTLRNNFKYRDTKLRLPDILVVENSNAVFVGIYGGLVAPMCFTELKEKASRQSLEKVFNGVKDWANTPERQAALIFSAFALVILGIKYYKVSIPTLITASLVVPPLLYSNQDRCDFFGVSYGLALVIHVPKLSDAEVIEYEKKAIIAREEAIKKIELKKKGS